MKRITQLLATVALSVGLMGAVASAATGTCNVTSSGTGSDTKVTCNEDVKNTVKCENNVTVANTNEQDADSGDATNSNNRVGGFSTTGNASNNNTATVELGIACAPIETASTSTPTTSGSSTPAASTPAGGSGAAAPAPAASASVAALPDTGTSAATKVATIGAISVVAGASLAQFAPAALRRFSQK